MDSSDQPVLLRGVQFTNWTFSGDPETADTYADESDYQRAAAMGMNTIAFYFDWTQFENDGAGSGPAFSWIDRNVEWARAAGIRLILTLAFAPGSEPTACDGDTLWDVPAYQQRTMALWRAIAKHYATEPVVAGYNLLKYPLPSGSQEEWHTLADQLVRAIREQDRAHLLVVEPAAGEQCLYKGQQVTDLFQVDDPNVLYEFSANVPWEYVAQLIPSQSPADGGSYPDAALSGLDFDATCGAVKCMQFEAIANDSTPPETALYLKPDQTTWTRQHFAYRVWNANYQIAIPILQSNYNSGKVFFDDFVINEYDEALNFVRTVMTVDLEDKANWYLWKGDSDGNECKSCNPQRAEVDSDAHSGKASVSLSGTSTLANLSNSSLAFPTKLHYTYEVIGWLKGKNSDPAGGSRFQLDFWKYNNGALPIRNKDNLASYLQSFVAWGSARRVPLFVGDFGTSSPTFASDKGGARWVEDMVDLLKANQIHFTYGEYHGDDFGIYPGNHGLPDPTTGNQPLIDLLTRELSQ